MNKRGFNRSEAIAYLGCKEKFFETEVRPLLAGTKMGTSLVFDRFDLDRAFDDIKRRNGRPAEKLEETQWAEPASQASTGTTRTGSGESTKLSTVLAFARTSAKIMERRKHGSSPRSKPAGKSG